MWPLACWDCGFESLLGSGCLSVVCCEGKVYETAGYFARGVMLIVCMRVCLCLRARLSVIVKPIGPLGDVATLKENPTYIYMQN
jgi:hypothetical protein